MDIPIISDTTHALSKAYGVLKEDEGIAYRGLFIIDTKGSYFIIIEQYNLYHLYNLYIQESFDKLQSTICQQADLSMKLRD